MLLVSVQSVLGYLFLNQKLKQITSYELSPLTRWLPVKLLLPGWEFSQTGPSSFISLLTDSSHQHTVPKHTLERFLNDLNI